MWFEVIWATPGSHSGLGPPQAHLGGDLEVLMLLQQLLGVLDARARGRVGGEVELPAVVDPLQSLDAGGVGESSGLGGGEARPGSPASHLNIHRPGLARQLEMLPQRDKRLKHVTSFQKEKKKLTFWKNGIVSLGHPQGLTSSRVSYDLGPKGRKRAVNIIPQEY